MNTWFMANAEDCQLKIQQAVITRVKGQDFTVDTF